MGAKKSSKGRKIGRSKRKPGAAAQSKRTAANKLKRVNHQRALARKPAYRILPMPSDWPGYIAPREPAKS
jgi:hypothetical protein